MQDKIMPASSEKICSISTYLSQVLDANASDGAIDLRESEELFEIAHNCGPETSGGDAIQFLYQQITGIPNPDRGQADPRPIVPGRFVTAFKEKSVFKEKSAKNICIHFDPFKPLEGFCADSTEPVLLQPVPIRWNDRSEQGTPYHMGAREGAALVAQREKNNWRILKEEADPDQGFEMIKADIHYPDLVSEGIRRLLQKLDDPWDMLTASYDTLDLFVANRDIDSKTKNLYGELLTGFVEQRLDQLPDKVYGRAFRAYYAETYGSYRTAVRDADELASGWRHDYFDKGPGFLHGATLTLGLFFVATPTVLTLGKMALGALGVAGIAATAPAWLLPAAIATGVGLVSYGAVYVYSRFKSEENFEKQFETKIKRSLPEKH